MRIADRLRTALEAPAAVELLLGDVSNGLAANAVAAAVMIAVTDRAQPGVILTLRREDMRTHAGQVAFPGGRIDPGETAEEAAVREAWEELELEPALIDIVGALEPYRTITGYVVTAVVGVIPPDLPLKPHDLEVADWFEAPLHHLIDPANHLSRTAVFDGRERHYYEILWKDRRIWGATAAMIVNLSRRLQWS